MTKIISVRGRRVWDSRARPTVEAEVTLEGGIAGRAIAPAGASMGSGEAADLRADAGMPETMRPTRGRGQAGTPSKTWPALNNAVMGAPTLRSSSPMASLVTTALRLLPPLSAITTCELIAPLATFATVPAN